MKKLLAVLILLCAVPCFSEIVRCKNTEKKLAELFLMKNAESGIPLKDEPEKYYMNYSAPDETIVYVSITSLKMYACDTIQEVNKVVDFEFTGERNYRFFTPYSSQIDKWNWETNSFSLDDISEDEKETSLAYQYYNLGKNEFGKAKYVVIKMSDGYSYAEIIFEEITQDFKMMTSVFLTNEDTIKKIFSMEAK